MGKVAGLDMIEVEVARAVRNPWNPNKMSTEMFEREKRSIQEHGFIDPITVRQMPDGTYQIIDGEHRWRAAQALGIKHVPASNLGVVPDAKAKKLTIIYNELRGAPDPDLLASLLADLSKETTIEQLAAELPFSQVEIETLVGAVESFDWNAAMTPDVPDPEGAKPKTKTGAEDRRFQLALLRGVIPVWLANALVAEFDASAEAVRSKTPEVVLKDWLTRLKASPPVPAPMTEEEQKFSAEQPARKRGKPRKSKGSVDASAASPESEPPFTPETL
jgi:ParB/RepB/Spo0J family partition protein